MQYKLTQNPNIILYITNNVTIFIPNDPANTDWQCYQIWLAEDPNNQPLPADE